MQAPTGTNRQDWHWLVVTDQVKRAKLAELYQRSFRDFRASSGTGLKQYPDDPARAVVQERVHGSADYLAEHMAEVPVLVLAALKVPGELSPGNQAGLWGSILPAVWNYMLAARTLGLGTAYTALHLAYEKETAELFGIPDDVRQAALIPTAFHTGEKFRPAPRRPLSEVVHYDWW